MQPSTEIQTQPASLKEDPLIREEEVRRRLGISQPTLFRHIRMGLLPKPLKIGSSNRWRESWIDRLVQEAEAAR